MATKAATRMRAGDVYRHDSQADIWRGRYKLVAKVPGERKTWIVEILPDDAEIIDAIVDYWAGQEAAGAPTSPVWDKTWAECADGERPQVTGQKTHEQMMTEELASRAARYGQRSKVTFISAAQYAEYF
jgi:hypothetical protein